LQPGWEQNVITTAFRRCDVGPARINICFRGGVTVTTSHRLPHLVISGENGRPLAGADIELDGSTARAALYVEAGHLPAGTRTRLVDAVFSTPQIYTCQQVQVTLPVGDTEILDRVRQLYPTGQTRTAGTTCMFDADLSARPGRIGPDDAEPDRAGRTDVDSTVDRSRHLGGISE